MATDGGFSLRHLLDDLHKLEINTIEKADLTAERMPAPLLAIRNVATEYQAYLGCYSTSDSPMERLLFVRDMARARLEQPDTLEQQRVMLSRIERNAVTLIGILERAQEQRDAERAARGGGRNDPHARPDASHGLLSRLHLKARDTNKQTAALEQQRQDAGVTGPIPDELYYATSERLSMMDRNQINAVWQVSAADRAQIRKIWEIGAERVLIQTVIQIEGDVVTRISPDLQALDKQYLLPIHQDGVKTAMRTWSALIAIAQGLIEAVGGALLGRK